MDKNKKNSFVKWLEMLQQESWQLELLISGFAIFLLAAAYDDLDSLNYQLKILNTGSTYFGTLMLAFQVLMGAWYVLMINLVLHVLLRGLWISTIGLRYVSGEIDFELLNFAPRFEKFLKKRIVSFDWYIQRLEQLCSIVFAFTFLIIFVLISLGLYTIGIVILGIAISRVSQGEFNGWNGLLIPMIILYLLGGVIYFVDFITLGWIKKRKFLSKIYYPIYRFFSMITFSAVYRPLYYNLIDNRFGRKVVLFLIPYLLILTLISSMRFEMQSYLPSQRENLGLKNGIYDDSWDGSYLVSEASIGSKYVSNGYIELYLPYNGDNDDKVIELLCPDLEPAKKGVFFLGSGNESRDQMKAEIALDCHQKRFKIYVDDSLMPDLGYRFFNHVKRKNTGLLTIIDVGYLKRGEHKLEVEALYRETAASGDTLVFRPSGMIPFWIE